MTRAVGPALLTQEIDPGQRKTTSHSPNADRRGPRFPIEIQQGAPGGDLDQIAGKERLALTKSQGGK